MYTYVLYCLYMLHCNLDTFLFQASLLSSAIRGNSSEVFQFNCLPVPEPCDCSFRKEACLNLTEFGSGGFPLFGRTTHLFRVRMFNVMDSCLHDSYTCSVSTIFLQPCSPLGEHYICSGSLRRRHVHRIPVC